MEVEIAEASMTMTMLMMGEEGKPESYELDDGYNPERWALPIDDRHHCQFYNALGI